MPLVRSGRRNISYPGRYSTNFPLTESPISDGGRWVNGGTTGLDWTNVQTSGGIAFATQTQHAEPPFDDSIAHLIGYRADHWCQGTIFNNSSANREVELLLRSNITPHNTTQYEIDITQSNGLDLAIWLGALNSFTVLVTGVTSGVSLLNGAVWYAQILGPIILVQCNGATVLTYDTSGDTVKISSGNPGMGFYGDTGAGTPSATNTLGFSSFSAGSL